MSSKFIMSGGLADNVKSLFTGALGAMTFGMYWQFVNDQTMKINNEKQDLKQDLENFKHKVEIDKQKEEIHKAIKKMENSRWW